MNTSADEKTKNWEYFNAPVNRYVRDASTRITANPGSGMENAPYRSLARAVIFNALKDLRDQIREEKRTLKMLETSPRFTVLGQYTDNWGRKVIQYRDNSYDRILVFCLEPSQDVRQFFTGEDYIFYAELGGINVSGVELMNIFLKRYPNGCNSISLDSLIDG